MSKMIKVGMADLNICFGEDCLTTLGLGSCVGIAIRDPEKKIGGLAHIMLPDSTAIKGVSSVPKFADTGIEELVGRMISEGAVMRRLEAKIAGGATMFSFQSKSELMRVGERNVEAVKQKLTQMHIPILAEDTGENYGRTVIFCPETGNFTIRAVGKEEKII